MSVRNGNMDNFDEMYELYMEGVKPSEIDKRFGLTKGSFSRNRFYLKYEKRVCYSESFAHELYEKHKNGKSVQILGVEEHLSQKTIRGLFLKYKLKIIKNIKPRLIKKKSLEICNMRFLNGFTYTKIGKIFNQSRQSIQFITSTNKEKWEQMRNQNGISGTLGWGLKTITNNNGE